MNAGLVELVLFNCQLAKVSLAPWLATSHYCVPKTKDTGETGVTVWTVLDVVKNWGRSVKFQLSITPPGIPPLSAFRLSTTESIPEERVIPTSICVSLK